MEQKSKFKSWKFWLKQSAMAVVYIFAIIGFVMVSGYFAVKYGLTKNHGVIDLQQESFLNNLNSSTSPAWTSEEEWYVLKKAIIKDRDYIDRAARDAGIPSRLLVSLLVPEQMRLFHSNRELFKQVLSPLQIIVSQNQFSWGIMGIKQDTATAIENHLKQSDSPFYLGKEYENVLNFKTDNIPVERFERITDEHNHYYGYLYAALYLKQIIVQWQKAGFDISNRPEILATIYNTGFGSSKPNTDPKSGGAAIDINGSSYSFGRLAAEFYYSDELVAYFER